MVVRLLALLIAVGLSASVVQASDLGARAAAAALVDEAEDVNETEAIVGEPIAVGEASVSTALGSTRPPPLYRHQHFVFRPPRAPAFN